MNRKSVEPRVEQLENHWMLGYITVAMVTLTPGKSSGIRVYRVTGESFSICMTPASLIQLKHWTVVLLQYINYHWMFVYA